MSSEQMWAACANSRILDALEAIVGPFAQIDNFTLAAFPSEHEKYGLGGGISVRVDSQTCGFTCGAQTT